MASLEDDDIDAALKRGQAARNSEPRATSATYDARSQKVVIGLSNGITVAVPVDLIEGLAGATAAERAEVEVQGSGYGLQWPALDIDVSVPGLMAGVFGTRAHMARLAGQATSTAKAAASRKNGAKGGRPRKQTAA